MYGINALIMPMSINPTTKQRKKEDGKKLKKKERKATCIMKVMETKKRKIICIINVGKEYNFFSHKQNVTKPLCLCITERTSIQLQEE